MGLSLPWVATHAPCRTGPTSGAAPSDLAVPCGVAHQSWRTLVSVIAATTSGLTAPAIAQAGDPAPVLKELTWYEHPTTGEGVAATDVTHLRLTGYAPRKKLGYVYGVPEPGTVPLRIFWHAERKDHYTVASDEGIREARALGYQELALTGHVYPSTRRGTTAVYSMVRDTDFIAATGMRDMARARMKGYEDVRLIGYVLAGPGSHEVAANDGKPSAQDADGDGVPDDKDKCPHLSVKRGTGPALDGCPFFLDTFEIEGRTVRRAFQIPREVAVGKPDAAFWSYFDRLRGYVKGRDRGLMSCLRRKLGHTVYLGTKVEVELPATGKPSWRAPKDIHSALNQCNIWPLVNGLPRPARGTYAVVWDWP